jgi:hypothetical protein
MTTCKHQCPLLDEELAKILTSGKPEGRRGQDRSDLWWLDNTEKEI